MINANIQCMGCEKLLTLDVEDGELLAKDYRQWCSQTCFDAHPELWNETERILSARRGERP